MDEEIEIQLTTASQLCLIQWIPQEAYTYFYTTILFSCQLNTTGSLQTWANSPVYHDMMMMMVMMMMMNGDENSNDDGDEHRHHHHYYLAW